MADDDAPKDDPTLTVTQFPTAGDHAVSMDAVASLVHAFAEMVRTSTGALSAQIDANARAGRDRWQSFEEGWVKGMEERVDRLESSVHDHHSEAERDQIRRDAYVKPVVSTTRWLVTNWPKVLALLFGVLGFAALLFDLLERYTGVGS